MLTSARFGSVVAGGTLGILIPPSVPMIIYGVMVQESIGRLFAAGVIPGILLALMFMVYIALRAMANPRIAPREVGKRMSGGILMGLLAPIFLVVLVLGGIFSGLVTATEGAALGVVGAFLTAVAYRSFNFKNLKESLFCTVKTTSMVMFIVVGAILFAFAMTDMGVMKSMTQLVLSLNVPPLVILLGIYLLYLVLGCILEPLSMMILTLPAVFPVIVTLGYDPVWFGIVLVVLMEAGMITPPVGLNLFIVRGIAPQIPFSDVLMGSLPFVIVQMVMLALLTVFPGIALWLPGKVV